MLSKKKLVSLISIICEEKSLCTNLLYLNKKVFPCGITFEYWKFLLFWKKDLYKLEKYRPTEEVWAKFFLKIFLKFQKKNLKKEGLEKIKKKISLFEKKKEKLEIFFKLIIFREKLNNPVLLWLNFWKKVSDFFKNKYDGLRFSFLKKNLEEKLKELKKKIFAK